MLNVSQRECDRGFVRNEATRTTARSKKPNDGVHVPFRINRLPRTVLDRANVDSLKTLRALLNVELDRGAFVQGTIA